MKSKKMAILIMILWIFTVIVLFIVISLIKHGIDSKDNVHRVGEGTSESNNNEVQAAETDVIPEDNKDDITVTETDINNPVSLFDCWTTFNDWDKFCPSELGNVDNMGKKHDKSYVCYGIDDSITVNLDGKYSRLEIKNMFLLEGSKNTGAKIVLSFYDENGTELKTSPVFTSEVPPEESFEVDVKGVKLLKICKRVDDYSYWGSCNVGIDEALLYIE